MSFDISKMFSAREASAASKKVRERGYDKDKFEEILSKMLSKVEERAKEGSFSAYIDVVEIGLETIHPNIDIVVSARMDAINTLKKLGYFVKYNPFVGLLVSWC